MPISVICPSCGNEASTPDIAAGRSFHCPRCGASIGVPPTGLHSERPASGDIAATGQNLMPAPVGVRSTKRRRAGYWLAALALGASFLIGMACGFLVGRQQPRLMPVSNNLAQEKGKVPADDEPKTASANRPPSPKLAADLARSERLAKVQPIMLEKVPLGAPVATVEAPLLWREYREEIQQADQKYQNKTIDLTGTVLRIDQDAHGRYYAALDAAGTASAEPNQKATKIPRGEKREHEAHPPEVRCFLDPTQQSAFAAVSGKAVRLRGRCMGKKDDPNIDGGYVVTLEDCVLVDRPNP